ncbi:hypothetical protein BWI93_27330 [Siphonobacter sp. BAB-5385]|uniref:hypothetical protein n=1 Tax=Siphonobacter sp. BAB-5385 TaxID=1864822 RepID=UPI000B9DE9CB|nr:hypothetical protein [Siphonobacter sp. BAB-5385]OZI05102.1 hypothetical protein BWI93_27330 [Siphonobacter sp. BAB-5385]
MTIFDYLNQFYEWKRSQGKGASDAATALYFYILKEANRQFWPQLITVAKKGAMEENGWGGENTYLKALRILRDGGLIQIKRPERNAATPALVRLLITVSTLNIDVLKNSTASNIDALNVDETDSTLKSDALKLVSTSNINALNDQSENYSEISTSENDALNYCTTSESDALEEVSTLNTDAVKGTIGVINTSSKTLEKENLEEDKKGDSEFFETGETPPFVKANREKIKNLIPVGPSPEQISEWLFENPRCREHACLKIKSIKRDSDEDYREFIAHFIRFNGARGVQWDSFELAAEHFMKMISSLNGFNPAKDNPQTHGKSKPKSGSLIPVASEPRPKPEPGPRKPGKFSGVKL